MRAEILAPELGRAEALARLRLARTDGIGPITHRRLLERHGSARAALARLPNPGPRPYPEAAAKREIDALHRLGGRFLHCGEADYPPLLALTDDAPPVLAVFGDAAALSRPRAVAIVGSRNASANGRRLAETLAEALAREGIAIVSGMARGIDAAAHLGALRAGRTVACVAGGLDEPYPPENAALQARVADEGGAVVTEAPLGAAPLARHFPRRNRIIAGLCLGLVVVEAAPRSGSLLTARLALEAGRELFAVPGSPLDPRCRGANDLIRQGAHLTETVDDIIRHLPAAPREAPLFQPRPPFHAPMVSEQPDAAVANTGELGSILGLLGPSPLAVDELSRRCHLAPAALQGILLDLELAGRVELLPGNRVARLAG